MNIKTGTWEAEVLCKRYGLTGEPQWVPEWKEYAAMTLAGGIVYGGSYAVCAEWKRAADETWARHNRGAS